jgi:hypothetical protein
LTFITVALRFVSVVSVGYEGGAKKFPAWHFYRPFTHPTEFAALLK